MGDVGSIWGHRGGGHVKPLGTMGSYRGHRGDIGDNGTIGDVGGLGDTGVALGTWGSFKDNGVP